MILGLRSSMTQRQSMTKLFSSAAFAVGFSLLASAAYSGPIEQACNRSNRSSANGPVCNCIQQVANMTLPGADQRRAAEFFKNPDKAHSTWMSQNRRDDDFWERYKQFGSYAEQYCGGAS
jgi:hypothetical protein